MDKAMGALALVEFLADEPTDADGPNFKEYVEWARETVEG